MKKKAARINKPRTRPKPHINHSGREKGVVSDGENKPFARTKTGSATAGPGKSGTGKQSQKPRSKRASSGSETPAGINKKKVKKH